MTNQKECRWASHCWNSIRSLRTCNSLDNSPYLANKPFHCILMWVIIYILMPFLKTFSWTFLKSPQILVPYVIVESTNALNGWDLCSQDVFPIFIYLFIPLRCPSRIPYLQFFAFYLIAQSNHMDKNQSQGIYIHGLSQFGPSLGWKPLGLYSFCCGQKTWFWV